MFLNEFLVHSVHVSDLTASYADIAGGYVAVGAYILPKAKHECLAEAHYLTVALAAWREVGAAFSSTHRQGCKGRF